LRGELPPTTANLSKRKLRQPRLRERVWLRAARALGASEGDAHDSSSAWVMGIARAKRAAAIESSISTSTCDRRGDAEMHPSGVCAAFGSPV